MHAEFVKPMDLTEVAGNLLDFRTLTSSQGRQGDGIIHGQVPRKYVAVTVRYVRRSDERGYEVLSP
jgi:hypothetical protein